MKKNLFFIVCAILLITTKVSSQIITTVAGDHVSTFGGDGLAATLASIAGPYSVAIDAAGNIYIGDQYNNRVRKVNTSGIINTIAGTTTAGFSGNGFAATLAKINQPTGVAVDAAGNVYISDYGNNCIRKVNTAGIISTYAGNGGLTAAYNGDGGSATSASARLAGPMGLAFDASGNLYIAELGNEVIREVSSAGILSTIAGMGPLSGGFSGDGGPATSAALNQPVDIALDASGNIYIADYSNNRIRMINTLGNISTVAGSSLTAGFSGDGGQATLAKLNTPTGISVNAAGVLFITDGQNNRIRNVYPTGIIYTLAGNGDTGYSGDGGMAHDAELDYPYGGCIDATGNFYFADYANFVIRKVTPFVNHLPSFAGGNTQYLNVCVSSGTINIDSLMGINDLDTTQTENWTVILNPSHGTLTVTYSAISTGSTILPAGLYYNHTVGSSAPDSFKICITDGIGFDTTTVYVNVQTTLPGATVTGIDSLCQFDTTTFSGSVTGGTWSSSSISFATVSGSGVVTGVTRGIDTIIYTRTNSCGSVISIKPVFIISHDSCGLNTGQLVINTDAELKVYPNPNNGNFTLNLLSSIDEPALVVITNVMGEKIKEFSTFTNKEIDLKLFAPAGIYFITLTTQQKKYSERISIEQ